MNEALTKTNTNNPTTPQHGQEASPPSLRETGGAGSPTQTACRSDSPSSLRGTSGSGKGAGGLGLLALAALAGCKALRQDARDLTGRPETAFAPASRHPEAHTALHTLNRVAFGPLPDDVQKIAERGIGNYLEEQLADTLPESRAVTWRVAGLDVQGEVESEPDTLDSLADEQILRETQQAALLRAVYSTHQLRETLVDFWTNHFNIYALKNDERVLIPVDAERVIRPHILGSFRAMLTASAHSPAMLSYLDNQLNKRGVANENYARELLELHTLGVHSGYSQRDIQEVARCFTGWRVRKGFIPPTLANLKTPYNGYEYAPNLHDDGAKYVPFLHLTLLPNAGQRDADTVLERLAAHPATARFLAAKLCHRYLGAAPPDIVNKAASAYLRHDTDIRALLRPILLDTLPEGKPTRPILKRPLEFVASALRTLAADTDGSANVQQHLTAMGQPLYQWPMPDGFPEKPAAWSGSLLGRWNFALALTANTIAGTTVDLSAITQRFAAKSDVQRADALMETILQRPADAPELARTRQQIAAHLQQARAAHVSETNAFAEAAGLVLSAPAFQWR